MLNLDFYNLTHILFAGDSLESIEKDVSPCCLLR